MGSVGPGLLGVVRAAAERVIQGGREPRPGPRFRSVDIGGAGAAVGVIAGGAALGAGALPTSGRGGYVLREGGAATHRVHDGGLGGGGSTPGGHVVFLQAALQEAVVRVAVKGGGVHGQLSSSILREADSQV